MLQSHISLFAYLETPPVNLIVPRLCGSVFLHTQVWTRRLPCTLWLYFSSHAGCLGDLACGAGAEFRRPAELCGTLSCQSSPFSLSGPTIALLILISPHSATTVYQGLLFSKLGQKVCESVGFRFDSDWKGLRHHLVREARQCSGRQWRRLSSAEFGTLSARDLVQTE